MHHQHLRPRLQISHGPKKKVEYEQPPNLGTLSPDLQPCSPPTFCTPDSGVEASPEQFLQIGKYIIRQISPSVETCTAVDKTTGVEYLCKVCDAPILSTFCFYIQFI